MMLAPPAVHLPTTSLISHHQILLKCAYLWHIVYSHKKKKKKPLRLLVGPDLALSLGAGQHYWVDLQLAPPAMHLQTPNLTLNTGLQCCGDCSHNSAH